MKIKTRIKRALAAFLRDELLDYIQYRHTKPYGPTGGPDVVAAVPFETVTMAAVLKLPNVHPRTDRAMGRVIDFYDELSDIKRQFAAEVMDHVHVDARELVSHRHYGPLRSVTLTLRVQRKQDPV